MGQRGPKLGSKFKKTLAREELAKLYRETVQVKFLELIEAQFDAAKGVAHLMAKDRKGQWTQVTDPAVMAKVLNSGESFYKIHAVNPNVLALKDIMDRLMGQPVKAIEVSGDADKPLVITWLTTE